MTYKNIDADAGVFFEHELEEVKSRAYEVEYPQLMARTVFPAASQLSHPGAQSVTYEMYDFVGQAKILHSYAADIPMVEVKGNRFTRQVYTEALGFNYSIDDIDAARMAGKPLNDMKAKTVRRGLLKLEDTIAFHGDSTTDIPSFLENPNVNRVVPTANWTDGTATGADIIDDLVAMEQSIIDSSNGVEAPNTLVVCPETYARLAMTIHTDGVDKTVLQHFLDNSAYITTVLSVPNFKVGGVKDGERYAMMYDRSPDKLWLEVVKDVTFLPAQEKALMFQVPAYMKTAGVICPFPKSVCIAQNV